VNERGGLDCLNAIRSRMTRCGTAGEAAKRVIVAIRDYTHFPGAWGVWSEIRLIASLDVSFRVARHMSLIEGQQART